MHLDWLTNNANNEKKKLLRVYTPCIAIVNKSSIMLIKFRLYFLWNFDPVSQWLFPEITMLRFSSTDFVVYQHDSIKVLHGHADDFYLFSIILPHKKQRLNRMLLKSKNDRNFTEIRIEFNIVKASMNLNENYYNIFSCNDVHIYS